MVKTIGEKAAIFMHLGEMLVQAVDESGILVKPKRKPRKVKPKRKAKTEKPALKAKTKKAKPAPRRREEEVEDEDETQEDDDE